MGLCFVQELVYVRVGEQVVGAYGVLDEVGQQLGLDDIYAHCFTGCWAARLLLERTDSGLLLWAFRRWG